MKKPEGILACCELEPSVYFVRRAQYIVGFRCLDGADEGSNGVEMFYIG